MSTRDHLSSHQFRYVHSTDADLKPGDYVLPAAKIGHQSEERDETPGYDPHRVYFTDTHHDYGQDLVGVHGRSTYAVEPVGKVMPDPEVEHWKAHYRGMDERGEDWHSTFGAEPGERWHDDYLGGALAARSAKKARVVEHLGTRPGYTPPW